MSERRRGNGRATGADAEGTSTEAALPATASATNPPELVTATPGIEVRRALQRQDPTPPAPDPKAGCIIRPVFLHFIGIEEAMRVDLRILDRCPVRWHLGDVDQVPIGMSFEADPVGIWSFRRLRVTEKQISFVPGRDALSMRIRLFVSSLPEDSVVRGVAMLDGNTALEMQTTWDVTTIVGSGSWYVDLERP